MDLAFGMLYGPQEFYAIFQVKIVLYFALIQRLQLNYRKVYEI
jgi:hypothetical protein